MTDIVNPIAGTAATPLSEISIYALGRRVILRSVVPEDERWIYETAVSEEDGYKWRLRGQVIPYDAFMEQLWADVLCQYVVSARSGDGQPLALLQAYKPDFANGHTRVTLLVRKEYQKAGWPIEGVVLFLNHLFKIWNFRKIYFEGPEFALGAMGSGVGLLFVEEGRYGKHEFHDGEFHDFVVNALYRETFAELVQERLGYLFEGSTDS